MSITISIIALTISVASFWLGLRNSALQREVSGPLLSASEGPHDNDEGTLHIKANFTNIGHITAFLTDVNVRPVSGTGPAIGDERQEKRINEFLTSKMTTQVAPDFAIDNYIVNRHVYSVFGFNGYRDSQGTSC